VSRRDQGRLQLAPQTGPDARRVSSVLARSPCDARRPSRRRAPDPPLRSDTRARIGVAAAQSAARGSEPDVYDGQAELWRDSLDDIVTAVSTAAGQQAALELLEDERRFIDLERSPLWIGEEHLVVRSASE
jgi:EthD domain